MLAHHLGNYFYKRGHVFPADGAYKEPPHLATAPVTVGHCGIGQKSALAPAAKHYAAHNAHNLKNVLLKKKQFANGFFRTAKEVSGRISAQQAHAPVRIHIGLVKPAPCHKVNRIHLGKILVDADKIHAKGTFARTAYTERLAVAQVSAHKAHAAQIRKSIDGFGIKLAVWLAWILGIIHVYLDDVYATHKHHVLPHLVADLAAKHRQDDKRRDAQGDRKHHPKAALTHNLPEADAYKV